MKAQSQRLPYALKGCDAIFYSVFRHLGCALDVRPVIDYNYYQECQEKRFWDLRNSKGSLEDLNIEDPEKPSRVGVGLPELKVADSIHDEACSTASVSAITYVKGLRI